MSNYIDAHDEDGWREVSVHEYTPHAAPKIAVMEDDGDTRYWVRDTMSSPLDAVNAEP